MFGTTTDGGVAFTNHGEEDDTVLANISTKKDKGNITCFNCNEKGHYSNECPKPDRRENASGQSGTQMLMTGIEEFPEPSFQFCQKEGNQFAHVYQQGEKLPQEWILLDNQSTVDVFSNAHLLRNIHTTDQTMTIMCNAGVTHTNMIGEMPGYPGEVWYNPQGIANILSMANVKRHYRVTYDSTRGNTFIVHKPNKKGISRNQKKVCFTLIHCSAIQREMSSSTLYKRISLDIQSETTTKLH